MKKTAPIFTPPWYNGIEKLIQETNPTPREIDESQLNTCDASDIFWG